MLCTLTRMENYADSMRGSQNIEEVALRTIAYLWRMRDKGLSTHHIAGIISTDGDEYIMRNMALLLAWRKHIMQQIGATSFVITAPVIFTPELVESLKLLSLPRDVREGKMQKFWDDVMEANVITNIHFTPGWERSIGARREHEMAIKLAIRIHYPAQMGLSL